ncbi:MAG: hypothetical protein Q9219_000520 [cf. Caloplaca sp. 3 TL-2023]
MDDDLQAAEDGVANGTSSFHKLGMGIITFLRATLGFEPEAMREASDRLTDAETTASADQKRAQRDPNGYRSAIYPPGSEFALCHAQSQLMSAIVGVLNESLTESIRGFYKLRKAFVTLDGILDAESRYVQGISKQGIRNRGSVDSLRSNRSARPRQGVPGDFGDSQNGITKQKKPLVDAVRQNEATAAPNVQNIVNDDEEDEFYDADESHEDKLQTDTYAGHIEVEGITRNLAKNSLDDDSKIESEDLPPPKVLSSGHTGLDYDSDSDIFSNSIDVFIHSGTNLCFGLLLVLISMIPPAFSKLLFIIGFHGDRDRGVRLLWQASKFHNINGAMAGLSLLGYYNAVVGFADILPEPTMTKSPDSKIQQDVQGYPKERCEALLKDMRTRHPKSQLWLLEEARMEAMNRRLSTALSILESPSRSKTPLKQVAALIMFEKSLNAMYSHKYDLCAESFVNCVSMNNWSHTLYYYIAGAAHVELYRRAKFSGMPDKMEEHATQATEYFQTAPKHAGKKKFMARQLPFDGFATRKVSKWEQRAKEWGVPLIDAVGVSPLEEMIYFWNGYRRMDESQLEAGLESLGWSDKAPQNAQSWAKEEKDEKAVLAILRAATYRNLRQWDKAIKVLKDEVLSVDKNELKGGSRDDWTAPCAHYETGVCCWMRRKEGGKSEEEWVRECEGWVEKAARWEGYELDARVGLKIATAQDTLKKYWEAKKGG